MPSKIINRAPTTNFKPPLMIPPKAPITDKNILQALEENWDPDHPDAFIPVPQATNWYRKFVISTLRDPRDLEIFNFALFMTIVIIPSGLFLFYKFTYIHAILHLAVLIPNIEMHVHALHNACHRPLFKKDSWLLSLWIPYILGPFCGQTWNTYYFHHIKMHHIADNGPEDASSTLLYQRDSLPGWVVYFGRFYLWTWYDLGHFFMAKSQYLPLITLLGGEYLTIAAALYGVYFSKYSLATIFVFVIPFHLVRLGMMQGNWTQHAFLDRNDPHGGGRKNSITCISSPFNARSYNDGYHASHHLNPLRHWMDHPRMFVKQRQLYFDEEAVIFKDLNYLDVWLKLITDDYKGLAKYWIHVGYGPKPSDDEIVVMLRKKTQRFSKEEIFKIYGKNPACW
ncbi:hypothetical protein HK096_007623 [Nowakowskiella sp. JEL0078]|nr:hypothetical protein HK096_007623 [Nowakowskiella sp. JEL0078]